MVDFALDGPRAGGFRFSQPLFLDSQRRLDMAVQHNRAANALANMKPLAGSGVVKTKSLTTNMPGPFKLSSVPTSNPKGSPVTTLNVIAPDSPFASAIKTGKSADPSFVK